MGTGFFTSISISSIRISDIISMSISISSISMRMSISIITSISICDSIYIYIGISVSMIIDNAIGPRGVFLALKGTFSS